MAIKKIGNTNLFFSQDFFNGFSKQYKVVHLFFLYITKIIAFRVKSAEYIFHGINKQAYI